jgi:hypothetical protein
MTSSADLLMSAVRLVEKVVAVVCARAPVAARTTAIPTFQSIASRRFLLAPPLQTRVAMKPANPLGWGS